MTSYQVKFWDVKKIGDTAKGRWRVRWAVAGGEHCEIELRPGVLPREPGLDMGDVDLVCSFGRRAQAGRTTIGSQEQKHRRYSTLHPCTS